MLFDCVDNTRPLLILCLFTALLLTACEHPDPPPRVKTSFTYRLTQEGTHLEIVKAKAPQVIGTTPSAPEADHNQLIAWYPALQSVKNWLLSAQSYLSYRVNNLIINAEGLYGMVMDRLIKPNKTPPQPVATQTRQEAEKPEPSDHQIAHKAVETVPEANYGKRSSLRDDALFEAGMDRSDDGATISLEPMQNDPEPETAVAEKEASGQTTLAKHNSGVPEFHSRAKKKPAPRRPQPLPETLQQWIRSPSKILINQSTRRLFVKLKNGAVYDMPVAVGRPEHRTPTGQYHVMEIRTNPSWTPTRAMHAEARRKGDRLPAVVPPGPHNPLGSHFIRFRPQYGIHGTNQPDSIGRAISRGCVRMFNHDIATVASAVKPGDGVTIVTALSSKT